MFRCLNRTCIVYRRIHGFLILLAFFTFLWHVWLATPWVSKFFGPLHMKQFRLGLERVQVRGAPTADASPTPSPVGRRPLLSIDRRRRCIADLP